MDTINQNDNSKCEICFDNQSDYTSFITCTHANDFCEVCVKRWLNSGHFTCPKCRIQLPKQKKVETESEVDPNMSDTSIDMGDNSLLMNNVPTTTTFCSMFNIVTRIFIAVCIVILCLFIYWSVKIVSSKE